MAEEATTAAADEAATAEEKDSAAEDRTAAEFREIADALRARVDLFGKTLAAVATLATTAVGLTKIGDLFPVDGWDWLWAVVACVSLFAAALAAIAIAVRLMRVSRPVFMSVDSDRNQEQGDEKSPEELDGEERKAVRPVFTAAAKQLGYESLAGLRERESSMRSAAAWAPDDDERARRLALADEVKAVIDRALAQAQVVVVRRRSTNAVSGLAWLFYAAVLLGLIMFAVSTDQVKSERTDRIAEAKACGEARAAKATGPELGRTMGVCDAEAEPPADDEAEEAGPSSAREARATVASQLTEVFAACAALVHEVGDADSGPLSDEDCKPVSEAAAALLGTAEAPPGP